MKKEKIIIIVLLLGLSFKSFAGTGNANDGREFLLAIVGSLLIILGLLYGADFLKKNGKTMINKTILFLNKKIALLRNYLKKVNSDYFDISYF